MPGTFRAVHSGNGERKVRVGEGTVIFYQLAVLLAHWLPAMMT
jgi:hypothetical protein